MNIPNNTKLSGKEPIFIEKIKSLSEENRKKLKRFAEIILNEDELQLDRDADGNRTSILIMNTVIPLNSLKKECAVSSLREAERLVYKLNEFSSAGFISFQNRNTEDILKSIKWNDERDEKKEDKEYYTNNLLVILDNSVILKRVISMLDKDITEKKSTHKTVSKDIYKLEFLKKTGRIEVYINENYHQSLGFSRNKSWGKMYELAENQSIDYDKSFYDYFTSNNQNPLYSNHCFSLTKILKQEDKAIVPNIEINLITQKKRTQRLNNT